MAEAFNRAWEVVKSDSWFIDLPLREADFGEHLSDMFGPDYNELWLMLSTNDRKSLWAHYLLEKDMNSLHGLEGME